MACAILDQKTADPCLRFRTLGTATQEHRLFAKLATILIGTALPLLAAELYLRNQPEESEGAFQSRFQWPPRHDVTGETPEALLKGYNDFAVYDPAMGYIGNSVLEAEKPFAQTKGYRVILLGDSITADWHYPAELERHMHSYFPKGNMHFLRAGVHGWGAMQEFRYLESRAALLKPNLVIVQFCTNDTLVTPVFWRTKDGKFAAYNAGAWGRWIDFEWISRSRLLRKIVFTAFSLRRDVQVHDLEGLRTAYEGMRRLSLEHGFELRIVLFPFFGLGPAANDFFKTDVRPLLVEAGLGKNTIDLLDLPERTDTARWMKHPDDHIHPNAEGAVAIAKEILPGLPQIP